jgi:tol-pal system protein YbgF
VPLSFQRPHATLDGRVRIGAGILCVVALLSGAGCGVPTRLATVERENAALRADVATLKTKVADLDGKLATLNKRVGNVANQKAAQKNLDQRLNPIEERLGLIEQQGREADDRAPDPLPTPRGLADARPSPTMGPELDLDGLRRESARELPAGYVRGIALMRDGDYEESIQAMRDFMRARHTSPFVAGANYWIGQAHLQLGQFYQAILAFTEVQQRFPRSEYAPSAGLAAGTAFLQLGNVSEARRAFEKVAAEYPASPEATRASERLQRLP